MGYAILAGFFIGVLLFACSRANAADYNYAERWFGSRPNVAWVVCDSTPQWQGRKFPVYCWVGYESGRWSDYRCRISGHGTPYCKRISSGQWLVETETCTTPAGGKETCVTEW